MKKLAKTRVTRLGQVSLFNLFFLNSGWSADAATIKIDSGDTAWVLVSSALVLLMTPGLAFFYAGMTRTKNVVSTLFQNIVALGVIGALWGVIGYSLAFSGQGSYIGDLGFLFLNRVGQEPNADFAATIPHLAFMIFQCMFAVITPALITGAVAERVRFGSWIFFMSAWSLLVYAPVAHWVWGMGGWIRNLGGLDFAGGMVVHMTAGYSALVLAILLGRRKDPRAFTEKPYSISLILTGASLLYFGWFGFNAGSALGANGLAAQAFVTTFFAGATAMLGWILADRALGKKTNVIGASCGLVAGLVAITPAAGFVTAASSLAIGLIAGVVCCYSVTLIKQKFKILDDSLDVFGCHGVGGTLGTILTAVFATKSVNPAGADGLLSGSVELLRANSIGAVGVVAFSVIGTTLIYYVVNFFKPMRVSEADELRGLDATQHAEAINSNFDDSSEVQAGQKGTKKVA